MQEGRERNSSAEGDLRTLCSTLHLDAPVVRRFVGDYLRLLQFRLDRIERDLAGGDIPAVVVGLLSLGTSSSMLGATGVVEAADDLRLHASSGDLSAIDAGRASLVAQVRCAEARLTRILNSPESEGVGAVVRP
ncbi:hypothetical protein GCM10011575_36240 [Microlunatus endophyticus]|uniref:HPt domain-containing protein n=1 Tax=Microlunatus endophyticus TaxID=1716077 RepID=A0A917W807_9ACTN|nr:hypothetical protein [Microlunatus endophyticus]GGL74777.1 hypothetical protein GCM10011575_36240 [Microlunatus endophyticus]